MPSEGARHGELGEAQVGLSALVWEVRAKVLVDFLPKWPLKNLPLDSELFLGAPWVLMRQASVAAIKELQKEWLHISPRERPLADRYPLILKKKKLHSLATINLSKMSVRDRVTSWFPGRTVL